MRSRRSFLIDSVAGGVAGISAAWIAANSTGILAAQEHAQGPAPKLGFFTEAQAAEIEAITAQIIPADDTPGAREARCVYFIDKALTTFAKSSQPVYTQGLQDLQANGKFSALTPEQQIKTLTAIEKTPFFNLVRQHTVIGFFARPVDGGNYDKIGWKLIGYDDSMNFKPPFGCYDAQLKG